MPDPFSARSATAQDRKLKRGAVIAIAIALVVVLAGVAIRIRAAYELKAANHDQAVPTVALAAVKSAGQQALSLPGAIQAFNSAAIHARTSGYLKKWYVDIGVPVKSGQLLAEIDTPDLDQQVLQARADLATAKANESLARTTAVRWAALLKEDAVSRQDADEKEGALAARSSALASSRANLDRLLALEGFKRIVAPFDGVVTSRNTDIGSLIAAGSPSDPALFTVADQRRLRVYVNVPQAYSGQVKKGILADLKVPEYPGQTFQAVMVGDSQAISTQNGTMLVELQIDNAAGRLKPGEYAQVNFRLPSPAAQVTVPATALLYREAGPTVMVAGPGDTIALRRVTVLRDLGASVEIGSGLAPHDRVIDNPPEGLQNGDKVHVVAPTPRQG